MKKNSTAIVLTLFYSMLMLYKAANLFVREQMYWLQSHYFRCPFWPFWKGVRLDSWLYWIQYQVLISARVPREPSTCICSGVRTRYLIKAKEINKNEKSSSGRTFNLAESIYFTKINRKRAKHARFFILIKSKTFQNARAHFSVSKNCWIWRFNKLLNSFEFSNFEFTNFEFSNFEFSETNSAI